MPHRCQCIGNDEHDGALQFSFSPTAHAVSPIRQMVRSATFIGVCPQHHLQFDDEVVGKIEVEVEDEDHDLDLHHLPLQPSARAASFHFGTATRSPIEIPSMSRGSAPRRKNLNDFDQIRSSSSDYSDHHSIGMSASSISAAIEKPHLDDFILLSILGQGAYGKVYLVQMQNTEQVFAMKCMKKSDVVRRKVVKYAHAERSVLIAASHPFIVHLRFAFQTETKLYLILDYIPGGELFRRLNAEKFFMESVAAFYSAEIVLALHHLHEQDIIYRDMKPENLLIAHDGHICLTDFGLAKPDLDISTGTKTLCGTLAYLAPEVLLKKSGYGKPADWWSLGILIFEMLAGHIPFDSMNPKELQKRILGQKLLFPSHLTNVAKSLLKKLLCRTVSARLGTKSPDEIKQHPFFVNILWDRLESKEMTPPFIPELSGPRDTDNFDTMFTSQHVHSPADGGPALSQSIQEHFKGFSFVR